MAQTYDAIASYTFGSAASSYTFSSIAASWTDLILVASIKYTVWGDYSKLTFNGDTNTNYSSIILFGNGTSAYSSRTSTAANIAFGYDANNETFTDIINVQNYANSTTYKTVLNRHSVAGTRAEALVGLWRKTPEAITSITLTAATNYASGTTMTLYGVKSA